MLANLYHIVSQLASIFTFFLYSSPGGHNATEVPSLIEKEVTTQLAIALAAEPEVRGIIGKFVGFICFAFLAVAGVLGNGLVIFVIKTDSALSVNTQLSNLPVLHLAYMDFLTTGIVCGSGTVAILFDEYPLGYVWCGVWAFWNLCGLITTIGLLSVISVDRFVAVGWSLHYPQWVTYNIIMGGCAYVWISCLLISFFWVSTEFEYEFWTGVCDVIWAHVGPDYPFEFTMAFFNAFQYVLIPAVIILVCNLLIIHFSKDKGRVGKVEKGKDGKEKGKGGGEAKANAKVLKAMIIVIVSFFALTFPSGILKILKVLGGTEGPGKHIPGVIYGITSMLQLGASIVNPLIYGLFRKDFRDAYDKLWKRIKEMIN